MGSVKIASGIVVVAVNQQYFRPTEVDLLIGDPKNPNPNLDRNKNSILLGWFKK